ncbi:DUF2953 domain-containing protein [Amphibacillus sediminis]|uniref:DUF2953 domain-containing protein n=1 Tax=Amphibacillus sediminis TaxID=360185 RepID=UPI0008309FAE|nr:DUF2953 domain-containing protein [Amphibacillus sediminis]
MFILLLGVILVVVIILCLFAPLIIRLTLHVSDEITFKLSYQFLFMPIYDKTYHFSFDEMISSLVDLAGTKQTDFSFLPSGAFEKMTCKELCWQTKIGVENAAYTANLTALILSFKGLVKAALLYFFPKLSEINFSVAPYYRTTTFDSHCQCMFSVSLGNAIYIYLKRKRKKELLI